MTWRCVISLIVRKVVAGVVAAAVASSFVVLTLLELNAVPDIVTLADLKYDPPPSAAVFCSISPATKLILPYNAYNAPPAEVALFDFACMLVICVLEYSM